MDPLKSRFSTLAVFALTSSPARAAESDGGGSGSGWLLSLLWAIGFDGQHTGRALLILLSLVTLVAVVAFLAYRQARREVRDYADRGRTAWRGARSRLNQISEKPEKARERALAASISQWEPGFRLEEFRHDRIRDFALARGLDPEMPELKESRLTDAQRTGDQVVVRMRFMSSTFEEEWAFIKPIGPENAWNTAEERILRRARRAA